MTVNVYIRANKQKSNSQPSVTFLQSKTVQMPIQLLSSTNAPLLPCDIEDHTFRS
jgi:hypothetical protein